MHCQICDTDSDSVVFADGDFTPCFDCQTVIYECVQGYSNLTKSEEDDILVDANYGC